MLGYDFHVLLGMAKVYVHAWYKIYCAPCKSKTSKNLFRHVRSYYQQQAQQVLKYFLVWQKIRNFSTQLRYLGYLGIPTYL